MAKIGPTQLVRMGNHSSRGAQPSSEALTANGRDCILLQVKCDAIETLVFGFKVKSEGGVVKSKKGQSHLVMH